MQQQEQQERVQHETELQQQGELSDYQHFYLIAGIMAIGTVTRIIRSKQPLEGRMIAGEIMLSLMLSIFLYAVGIYQDRTLVELVLICVPACLGNVRVIQYFISYCDSKRGMK